MSERSFQMRLVSRYATPDNSVAELEAEHLIDGAWQPFDLNLRAPGFQVFVFAVLTCQHMYFRSNCAEQGLGLESAEGSIEIVAGENWEIKRLHVHFTGKLDSGTPSEETTRYIAGRMGQCPVSINLKPVPDIATQVDFVGFFDRS